MRILLFNFFAGILRRGIPVYVENLSIALECSGFKCYELRCPRILDALPRPAINVLFVLTEQLIMPIAGMFFDKSIYPHNSIALLAVFSSRASLIVHDLIPNHARDRKFSSRYVRATQRIFARCGGDVIYSSRQTMRMGRRFRQFPISRIFLFPNAFYRLISVRSEHAPARQDFVLLCSGWGEHKDLSGALSLYLQSGLFRKRPLRILGLAGRKAEVDAFMAKHVELAGKVSVCPRLSDSEVVAEYESASWIWIHSLKEGFGRSLAEARICGCRVVASDIASFREQADTYTFLYSGIAGFLSAVAQCEAAMPYPPRRSHVEHDQLMAEIPRYISPLGA